MKGTARIGAGSKLARVGNIAAGTGSCGGIPLHFRIRSAPPTILRSSDGFRAPMPRRAARQPRSRRSPALFAQPWRAPSRSRGEGGFLRKSRARPRHSTCLALQIRHGLLRCPSSRGGEGNRPRAQRAAGAIRGCANSEGLRRERRATVTALCRLSAGRRVREGWRRGRCDSRCGRRSPSTGRPGRDSRAARRRSCRSRVGCAPRRAGCARRRARCA